MCSEHISECSRIYQTKSKYDTLQNLLQCAYWWQELTWSSHQFFEKDEIADNMFIDDRIEILGYLLNDIRIILMWFTSF